MEHLTRWMTPSWRKSRAELTPHARSDPESLTAAGREAEHARNSTPFLDSLPLWPHHPTTRPSNHLPLQ